MPVSACLSKGAEWHTVDHLQASEPQSSEKIESRHKELLNK